MSMKVKEEKNEASTYANVVIENGKIQLMMAVLCMLNVRRMCVCIFIVCSFIVHGKLIFLLYGNHLHLTKNKTEEEEIKKKND